MLQSYSECQCILSVVFLCFQYYTSIHSIFACVVHQLFIGPKIAQCSVFLVVLSRDLLYRAISITSSFDFFSVNDETFEKKKEEEEVHDDKMINRIKRLKVYIIT